MSIRAQRSPRKKDELTIMCQYERAAKSKSERGLVGEVRQSELVSFGMLLLSDVYNC